MQVLTGVSGLQLEIIALVNTTGAAGVCGLRVLSTGTSSGQFEYTSVGLRTYDSSGVLAHGMDIPGGDYNVTNVQYSGGACFMCNCRVFGQPA